MENILKKIVLDKKIWLENKKKEFPLTEFISKLTPSNRSLYDAINSQNPKTSFILECKKSSPSKGLIREKFDLDYIISVYSNHASAISVLTDEKYFSGKFEFLKRVSENVPCPVLCKDFIVDTYQIQLARHYGADAILLMLSVLNDEEYKNLSLEASKYNLDVLTEVSNEQEAKRAIELNAKILGINNRNLRDLSINLNRTKELSALFPSNVLIISESGINNNQQVREIANHANGFLVGSSLMQQENLELAVRSLLYGENKVCGLTRAEDAKNVYDANFVFGGLIFVKSSPRCITEEKAQEVTKNAPLNYVGVFQNEQIETIIKIAANLKLFAVQLHGTESLEYIASLRKALPKNCKIWQAISFDSANLKLDNPNINRYVIDSKSGNQLGGTGKVFDWNLLDKKLYSNNTMLAGGLSANNAIEAANLGCIGLDFNSGVEKSPAIKDKEKIQNLMKNLRKY